MIAEASPQVMMATHDDAARHAERTRRVMRWFAPARFGLFHHWGLYTGGGSTCDAPWAAPLVHPGIQAFEAAAPEALARNLVATAGRIRAGYLTFTVTHSCGGWAVMDPTRVPGFLHVATRDYVGALPYVDWVADWAYKQGRDIYSGDPAMESFMSWAGGAITGTTGGELREEA